MVYIGFQLFTQSKCFSVSPPLQKLLSCGLARALGLQKLPLLDGVGSISTLEKRELLLSLSQVCRIAGVLMRQDSLSQCGPAWPLSMKGLSCSGA